jgi:hypothetical protein
MKSKPCAVCKDRFMRISGIIADIKENPAGDDYQCPICLEIYGVEG